MITQRMISSTTIRKEERKELAYQYREKKFRLYAIREDKSLKPSLKLIGTAPLSQHQDLKDDKRTLVFIDDLIKSVKEGHSLAEELKQEKLKYIAYPVIKLDNEPTKVIRNPECGLMNYEF
ncbi:MAG: hypothetical protein AABW91_02475 [Nanoarchaeota archaeon]